MGRFAIVLVALAALAFEAQCKEVIPQLRQVGNIEDVNIEAKGVEGIPVVVESNLPTNLNNIAIAYSQNALDQSPNLVSAAQRLHDSLTSYDSSHRWSAAIQPAAYYVTSHYFAHYIYNNYHVYIYSSPCGY